MKTLYTTAVTATGGREGAVRSADGKFEHKLVMPKELGGPGGDATNPEQLFAAAYSACFEGALRLVAGKKKIRVTESHVTAAVSIGALDAGGLGLAVTLSVSLPGMERSLAEALVAEAHTVCPYSLATRNNIDVTLRVE